MTKKIVTSIIVICILVVVDFMLGYYLMTKSVPDEVGFLDNVSSDVLNNNQANLSAINLNQNEAVNTAPTTDEEAIRQNWQAFLNALNQNDRELALSFIDLEAKARIASMFDTLQASGYQLADSAEGFSPDISSCEIDNNFALCKTTKEIVGQQYTFELNFNKDLATQQWYVSNL